MLAQSIISVGKEQVHNDNTYKQQSKPHSIYMHTPTHNQEPPPTPLIYQTYHPTEIPTNYANYLPKSQGTNML